MSGHTFRFRWTVQDLEVFFVWSKFTFGTERVKSLVIYFDDGAFRQASLSFRIEKGSKMARVLVDNAL